jgi:hypothetical protein
MNVLYKGSDPRCGGMTTQLSSISLAEPDPSLFIPPADYTIAEAATGVH